MPGSRPYEATLAEALRDPEDARAYLNAALEEDGPAMFLLALKDVTAVHGVGKVAENAGINRVSLYKALSGKGNPKITTLNKLLHALGLKLAIEKAA